MHGGAIGGQGTMDPNNVGKNPHIPIIGAPKPRFGPQYFSMAPLCDNDKTTTVIVIMKIIR